MQPNVLENLKQRGLLEAVTDPAINSLVNNPCVAYAGFDPSSNSLQAGNLIAAFGLAHFQRCGHRVIAVAGGATGLVGDPSGKSSDRSVLTVEQVEANLVGITENLSRLLDFDHPTAPAKILNNNDWMKKFTFVDFLREVGRHFRIGTMLNKESVRTRLAGEAGMSFAEFSYQLLQSYDFLHLYDTEGCRVQLGGSDQWGNITAGTDLIRKVRGGEAYGATFPIVCDAAGHKFGKSEGNAIYLDHRRTSYYNFYQFFVRTTDTDVVRFLKMFTFLPLEEIAELERTVREAPERRDAQKKLADEITKIVHGKSGLDAALRATAVLFGGSMDGLMASDLVEIFADVPSSELSLEQVANRPVIEVAAAAGLCTSRGEARRLITGGGLYVNNERATAPDAVVQSRQIVDGRVLVMRSGKKSFHLVKIA
ncbi:MAG: tyrosine--tRNA ligase [bacterium]